MNRTILTMLLAILMGCFSAVAEELKIESNIQLINVGPVYDVNLQTRSILIGDSVLQLSRSLVVHEASGLTTDFAIQPDRQIRFRLNENAINQGNLIIEEIWLLDDQ